MHLVPTLKMWANKEISHPSAIMRARRKVQEDHKETRGSVWEARHKQQQQVQEIAQTGPSTYEQAKGLFPYLDDRLIRLYLDKYAESGNERLALSEMRADPIIAEVYPGIKRTDGTLRMTEQEYVAALDNMKASLRNYNLNPNEFEDDIVGAISGAEKILNEGKWVEGTG